MRVRLSVVVIVVAAVVLLAAALAACVVLGPRWIVDSGDGLAAAERLRAENDIRATLLQGLGGLLVLGGVALGATSKNGEAEVAQVRFLEPSPEHTQTIAHGQNVWVSGSIQGIGTNTMWIVKPDAGEGYYTTNDAPVATFDGNWRFEDQAVGDETDVGHAILYMAVQADQSCSQGLRYP